MKTDRQKIKKIKKLLETYYGEHHWQVVGEIKAIIYNLPKRKYIEWDDRFKQGEKLKELPYENR